jgi:DnaK suppressor protein
MATVKKSVKTVQKKAVKPSSMATKKILAKQKKAVTPTKSEKVVKKSIPSIKVTAKSSQKLSPRELIIHQIKLKLLRQKEMLLNEAEVALNELPGQTIFPDLGDQATAETDRNFMLRLRGREQRLLKKIDQALERVESGIFGICEDCGNEINIQRLEARPVTTMCIDCKTLQEEEERMRES